MKKTISKNLIRGLGLACMAAAVAQAGPYGGTPNPVLATPGDGIPTPDQVTGKEYLDMPNKNAVPPIVVTPQQSIAWDGTGGVRNGINYMGTTSFTGHSDGLANHADVLFGSVIQNQAALLVSVTGDSVSNSIWSESLSGGRSVWATKAQIDQHSVVDLDGLEVWGTDGVDDSDRFSLLGDPGGTAVWAYHAGGSVALLADAFIGKAIGLDPLLWPSLDLDAVMMFDHNSDIFAAGDQALISIRPIGGFDGGEVWVLDGDGTASYLNHGGHLWDTAFDVMTAFNVGNENIDALEAVATPEPSVIGLLTLGGLAGLHRLLRKKP